MTEDLRFTFRQIFVKSVNLKLIGTLSMNKLYDILFNEDTKFNHYTHIRSSSNKTSIVCMRCSESIELDKSTYRSFCAPCMNLVREAIPSVYSASSSGWHTLSSHITYNKNQQNEPG